MPSTNSILSVPGVQRIRPAKPESGRSAVDLGDPVVEVHVELCQPGPAQKVHSTTPCSSSPIPIVWNLSWVPHVLGTPPSSALLHVYLSVPAPCFQDGATRGDEEIPHLCECPGACRMDGKASEDLEIPPKCLYSSRNVGNPGDGSYRNGNHRLGVESPVWTDTTAHLSQEHQPPWRRQLMPRRRTTDL